VARGPVHGRRAAFCRSGHLSRDARVSTGDLTSRRLLNDASTVE